MVESIRQIGSRNRQYTCDVETERLSAEILGYTGLVLLGIGQLSLVLGAIIALIKKCRREWRD